MEEIINHKRLILERLERRVNLQIKAAQNCTTKAAIVLAFLGVLVTVAIQLTAKDGLNKFLLTFSLVMVVVAGRDAIYVALTRGYAYFPDADGLAKLANEKSERALDVLIEECRKSYEYNNKVLEQVTKRLDRSIFDAVTALILTVAGILTS